MAYKSWLSWKYKWLLNVKVYLEICYKDIYTGRQAVLPIPNSGNENGDQANKWIILPVASSKVEAWLTRPCAGQRR